MTPNRILQYICDLSDVQYLLISSRAATYSELLKYLAEKDFHLPHKQILLGEVGHAEL